MDPTMVEGEDHFLRATSQQLSAWALQNMVYVTKKEVPHTASKNATFMKDLNKAQAGRGHRCGSENTWGVCMSHRQGRTLRGSSGQRVSCTSTLGIDEESNALTM